MVGSNQVTGIGIQFAHARTGDKQPFNSASTDYVLRPQTNTLDFTAYYVRHVTDTPGVGGAADTRDIGTGQVNAGYLRRYLQINHIY